VLRKGKKKRKQEDQFIDLDTVLEYFASRNARKRFLKSIEVL
jgi:hypothetical protein